MSILAILGRELKRYLYQPAGYIIIAAVLLINGLLFNTWAVGLGEQPRMSGEVLERFFFCASGTLMMAATFNAMRLFAEEREQHTLVLLSTSPLKDWEIVAGKFLGALLFFFLMTALTAYMPALVFLNGKVSLGHIATGYLGLLLLGSAATAMGLFCSAISPSQLVAAFLSAGVLTLFVIFWFLARFAEPPIDSLLAYLSLHDKHFRPFMKGILNIRDIVFYLSLTGLALAMSTRVLESRRSWE